MRPFLRRDLHLAHIFLTDALIFIPLVADRDHYLICETAIFNLIIINLFLIPIKSDRGY